MGQRAVRALAEVSGWALVACAVWIVTLSGVTVPELCFAIAASIPCGILARAGRRALGGSWRFRPRWLSWPAAVVPTLLAEFVVLLHTSVRHPRRGRLTTIELPDEEPELAAGREATATLALCSTPGSVVAHCDPGRHLLTVHTFVSAGPDLESVVAR
jgi:hypothetical protein